MTTIPDPSRKTKLVPPTTPDFGACQKTIRLYPSSNYVFATKDAQVEDDASVQARMLRLKGMYNETGMLRYVEGVFLCHEFGTPYVFMLQLSNNFFKLPGEYLKPDETDEEAGLLKRLAEKLSPQHSGNQSSSWSVLDCLAQWWRPNFEVFMYPFLPPHISRPKECKKTFLISLPEKMAFFVPSNMTFLAVPLFELYDNPTRYGPQLSALPHYLSRYNFECVGKDGNVVSRFPGSSPASVDAPQTLNVKGPVVSKPQDRDAEARGQGEDKNDAMSELE